MLYCFNILVIYHRKIQGNKSVKKYLQAIILTDEAK